MQLFAIEQTAQNDTLYTFEATLDPTHKIFEGHFPNTPVVPGVCTMDMIKSCCGRVLNKEVRYDAIKEVKFLATILPVEHQCLEVAIEFREEMSISVVVKCEDKTMLKLRAALV